ncbi:MAG: hypothetical protein M3159_06755 [Actinomycetota bacterium]|nr:hypothetical protein [Actinomycetota bacterium]
MLLAEEFLLGNDLLAWLLLALGGALVLGNAMALLRPPPKGRNKGDLARAPVGRSVLMMAVGLVATIWALATLTGG